MYSPERRSHAMWVASEAGIPYSFSHKREHEIDGVFRGNVMANDAHLATTSGRRMGWHAVLSDKDDSSGPAPLPSADIPDTHHSPEFGQMDPASSALLFFADEDPLGNGLLDGLESVVGAEPTPQQHSAPKGGSFQPGELAHSESNRSSVGSSRHQLASGSSGSLLAPESNANSSEPVMGAGLSTTADDGLFEAAFLDTWMDELADVELPGAAPVAIQEEAGAAPPAAASPLVPADPGASHSVAESPSVSPNVPDEVWAAGGAGDGVGISAGNAAPTAAASSSLLSSEFRASELLPAAVDAFAASEASDGHSACVERRSPRCHSDCPCGTCSKGLPPSRLGPLLRHNSHGTADSVGAACAESQPQPKAGVDAPPSGAEGSERALQLWSPGAILAQQAATAAPAKAAPQTLAVRQPSPPRKRPHILLGAEPSRPGDLSHRLAAVIDRLGPNGGAGPAVAYGEATEEAEGRGRSSTGAIPAVGAAVSALQASRAAGVSRGEGKPAGEQSQQIVSVVRQHTGALASNAAGSGARRDRDERGKQRSAKGGRQPSLALAALPGLVEPSTAAPLAAAAAAAVAAAAAAGSKAQRGKRTAEERFQAAQQAAARARAGGARGGEEGRDRASLKRALSPGPDARRMEAALAGAGRGAAEGSRLLLPAPSSQQHTTYLESTLPFILPPDLSFHADNAFGDSATSSLLHSLPEFSQSYAAVQSLFEDTTPWTDCEGFDASHLYSVALAAPEPGVAVPTSEDRMMAAVASAVERFSSQQQLPAPPRGSLGEPQSLQGSGGAGGREEAALPVLLPGGMRGRAVAQLVALAEAYATDDQAKAEFFFSKLKSQSDPSGSSMQRLVHYFLQAITAREEGTGFAAFACPVQATKEDLSKAMEHLCRTLPFVHFNQSLIHDVVAEVAVSAPRLHIVGLGMWGGERWSCLLRELANQPGGPPEHVIITGVDGPATPGKVALQVDLKAVGEELRAMAQELRLNLEYHALEGGMESLQAEAVGVRPGYAVVVCCCMRMQYLPDSHVVRWNPRDALLQTVRELHPTAFVMIDTDADFNSPFFLHRFRSAATYFSAIYEALEFGPLPANTPFRRMYESCYFARDILSVVSCEGAQRMIRPERAEQWAGRLRRVGLYPRPLPATAFHRLQGLLEKAAKPPPDPLGNRARGFEMVQVNETIRLMWGGTPLLWAGVWRAGDAGF